MAEKPSKIKGQGISKVKFTTNIREYACNHKRNVKNPFHFERDDAFNDCNGMKDDLFDKAIQAIRSCETAAAETMEKIWVTEAGMIKTEIGIPSRCRFETLGVSFMSVKT